MTNHGHDRRAEPTDASVDRFDVTSRDGTSLAVWVQGRGPALVMVHGSLSDHRRFEPLITELRGEATTFAMDRRGFGASGDGTDYDIEREFEDVAAVVDAVAARTGGPVALWGHSYGANCAMGGAARTPNLHHVVLYEPSLGMRFAPGALDAIDAAIAVGDLERAIVIVLAEVLEMSQGDVAEMKASPLWAMRLASAATLAREGRTEEGWRWRPGHFSSITAPVHMLTGSDSPEPLARCTALAAHAIPGVEVHTLAGHGHLAHVTDPAMVAGMIRSMCWATED